MTKPAQVSQETLTRPIPKRKNSRCPSSKPFSTENTQNHHSLQKRPRCTPRTCLKSTSGSAQLVATCTTSQQPKKHPEPENQQPTQPQRRCSVRRGFHYYTERKNRKPTQETHARNHQLVTTCAPNKQPHRQTKPKTHQNTPVPRRSCDTQKHITTTNKKTTYETTHKQQLRHNHEKSQPNIAQTPPRLDTLGGWRLQAELVARKLLAYTPAPSNPSSMGAFVPCAGMAAYFQERLRA